MTTLDQPLATLAAPAARSKPARKRWPLSLTVGVAILIAWVLFTILVPPLIGRSATDVVYGSKLLPPSPLSWFGTDALGRDLLVRTAVAFRYDILVAMTSVLAAAAMGLVLGAIAGTAPEWIDNLLMGITDVISAFPNFVLALAMAAAFSPSPTTLVLSIAIVFMPYYARTTRAAILTEKNKPYADAARAMGLHPIRIVFLHLLPNSVPYTMTLIATDVSGAIMVTAGLSFLGFGVQPPDAEWGLMISEGNSFIISGEWWVSFFPGVAVMSLISAFLLIDLGIRKIQQKF
ncbi:MAG: peptide transporter permease [Devosia sp.]|uniref:ABC transporter permease n=1 Tax=Devosia sp. TaxID=1871048 RepID=UPI0026368BDA|nr:ABC transporter permease [Devosia sp.]MDB5541326.1 peptide transporter permease [Devosia sp.]